jgi:hypothetical protein
VHISFDTPFLGLFYARGYFSWNYENYERIWDVSRSNSIFTATMGLTRFKQLLQFLTFDDKHTRDYRYKRDKLAAARKVFEIFNDNCGKYMMSSAYVTIDECLYSCRNQISFKQYIKNKPRSYGLNIHYFNDVNYTFTYRSEVFSGKPDIF